MPIHALYEARALYIYSKTHKSFWIGAMRTKSGETVLLRESAAGGKLEDAVYSNFDEDYPKSGCVSLDRLSLSDGKYVKKENVWERKKVLCMLHSS